MASAHNPHPTDRQKTSSASKMTNSNNETTKQNYHQQELIKMLAQHFNNQLAANGATAMVNQQLLTPLAQSGSAMNDIQSALVHYHQQNQHQPHYRMSQGAINFSTQNRAANLEPPSSQSSFLASQPSVRPQQPEITRMNPFSMANPAILPMVQHPAAACNPFMNDMNLFNALNCFGIPNDQFVLSLQQQYILQAATAARHIESRLNRGDSGNLNLINEQQSSPEADGKQQNQNFLNKRILNGNLSELGSEIASNPSGRELLKFSINTILGRRSPLPSCAINGNQPRPGASPINRFFSAHGSQQQHLTGSKMTDDNDTLRNAEQPISPECDPDIMTDLDSESSLTGPATNAQCNSGMATNLSRMSSEPEHLDHHHNHLSASNSTKTKQNMAQDTQGQANGDAQHSSHQHASLSFLAGSTSFPWTVASRGKPRRGMMRRAVFSDSQRVGLEKRFQLQKYISKPDRKKLAEKLGLRDSQVKIWFQNRRMKWRNSKERELLSAGGSREQTLPTRNNPNPDLSDVGQTFKRLVPGSNNIGTV